MESQFGNLDIPFYTGRLRGLRSFAITKQGELTGVTYAGRWVDGENEAKCALWNKDFYDWDPNHTRPQNHDETHQVASMGCSCGYYAFFDGNNNEYQHGVNVEGVVEAWGKITIGDKGFRTAKARIAALVIPIDAYPKTLPEKLLHRTICPAGFHKSHAWSYPYLANEAGCSLPLFPEPTLMQTIIDRYPSAQIFNTIEEATAAFPLTSVEVAKGIVDAQ